MNIDKFKHQHDEILNNIAQLRQFSQAGIAQNAQHIAHTIVTMSATVKLHLSAEDRVLYPALAEGANNALAAMSHQYQQEMKSIAADYDIFSRRWNTANAISAHQDEFRHDANTVLRRVYERMQRENHDFYPQIEAL